MKKYKWFRPRIRSRHPSHDFLRSKFKKLPLFDFKSVIRFGSLSTMLDTVSNGGNRIELNTVDAIKNSMNKLLMKKCFTHNKIKTAKWYKVHIKTNGDYNFYDEINKTNISHLEISYPIITKNIFGSKGKGNKKHDNKESFEKWLSLSNPNNYIIEKFYNYNREYRLHITKNGCFYTCRKMLKSDTPADKRWYRNDDNSVWIVEENEAFDKPVNWDEVIKESIKALKAVGLDFGAVDLRIQSATNKDGERRTNPKFIVVEINSAPGLGKVGEQKYLEMIPILLKKKNERQKEK
jgi:D-alanine-D-alanine ligase-like ATP-grasp enzyme